VVCLGPPRIRHNSHSAQMLCRCENVSCQESGRSPGTVWVLTSLLPELLWLYRNRKSTVLSSANFHFSSSSQVPGT